MAKESHLQSCRLTRVSRCEILSAASENTVMSLEMESALLILLTIIDTKTMKSSLEAIANIYVSRTAFVPSLRKAF